MPLLTCVTNESAYSSAYPSVSLQEGNAASVASLGIYEPANKGGGTVCQTESQLECKIFYFKYYKYIISIVFLWTFFQNTMDPTFVQ